MAGGAQRAVGPGRRRVSSRPVCAVWFRQVLTVIDGLFSAGETSELLKEARFSQPCVWGGFKRLYSNVSAAVCFLRLSAQLSPDGCLSVSPFPSPCPLWHCAGVCRGVPRMWRTAAVWRDPMS